MFKTQTLPQIQFIGLLALLVIASFFEVGSYDSHLANAIADDHPAVWAKIFSNPEFDKNDPRFQVAAGFIFSSLPNLIAAFSARLNPKLTEWFCYLFLAIQTFGLVLSLYMFCKVFIKNHFRALLTATLTFFIHPWVFNLAYYPNLIFTPYPGQLVLPFLVLGAASFLKNKIRSGCVWLSIAGLIHPALTLQFLVIIFFYFLFTYRFKTHLRDFLWLGIPTFFSLLLPLWIMPQPAEPLTHSELLPSLLSHPHAFPWKSLIFWPWAVPSFLGILLLSGFSLRNENKPFFKANIVAFLLLGTFHFLSSSFLFFEGAVFSGLRVTTLCSLLLLPFGVSYLLEQLLSGIQMKRVWAFFVLGFLVVSQKGLPWVGFLGLALKKKFSKVLFFCWWGLFLVTLRPMRVLGFEELGSTIRYFLAPALSYTAPKYSLILGLCLILLLSKEKRKALFEKLSLATLLLLGVWGSYDTGANSREQKKIDFLAVQNWAREKTPKDAAFITTQWSWQGKSERPGGMIYKPPFGTRNPYFRFGRKKQTAVTPLEELFKRTGAETIGDLDNEALRDLSKITGSQFLVMEKDKQRKAIALPVCFENGHYKVYDLSHPTCSVG